MRAFGSVGGEPFFVARGEGAFLVTEDGQRVLDYVQSWGASILGHAHPVVVDAVRRAAADGTSFGAPTAREVELAEAIAARVPSVEKVRLVSSGKPMEPTERPRFGVITHGPTEGRLPVEGVAPGSPAEAAGLRAGDEIVGLNGHDVQGMSTAQIGEAFQSRPLAIALLRAGETIQLKIEAKSAP